MNTKRRFGLGQVVLDATAEAGRRGDRRVGTEHIALALLVDDDSVAAQALGVDLATAREALQTLDRRALAAVGIDAPDSDLAITRPGKGRVRLTPAAVGVFKSLGKVAKGERLGLKHVLLALLSREPPDPAAELLDALGVDRPEVRRRLAA